MTWKNPYKQLIFVGTVLLLCSGIARAQTMTVFNVAKVPERQLARAEAAVQWQATQLARYWHTPQVTFGPGGWPVYLINQWWMDRLVKQWMLGYHSYWGTPYAVVMAQDSTAGWEQTFSHETMEMLADPLLNGVEVCDPLNGNPYFHDGVALARFIHP